MASQPPYSEHDLLRLERRLSPSSRRAALTAARKALWHLASRAGRRIKRMLDILIAVSALIALAPLLLIVATAVKLTDGGPVLYWQTRIGKWGKPFRFPKFRSMVANADELRKNLEGTNMHSTGVTFKMKDDPRITRVGRFIRKTSIDELPQLWCVLKGEMSLVGPRPALTSEVARYSLDDRRRLDAIPGLTCTWQVAGRSDIPFPEQLRLDVEYIERQSIREDLKLLLKTVPAVIVGRGAY
jgi:lipopolysaccharide/colanic/teichoic acid biosynthesis glycosyltransferase